MTNHFNNISEHTLLFCPSKTGGWEKEKEVMVSENPESVFAGHLNIQNVRLPPFQF